MCIRRTFWRVTMSQNSRDGQSRAFLRCLVHEAHGSTRESGERGSSGASFAGTCARRTSCLSLGEYRSLYRCERYSGVAPA